MKKSTLFPFIAFFYLLVSTSAYGQIQVYKRGEYAFEKLEYPEAIKYLSEAADKGYQSADLYQMLGDSHYILGNMTEASKWYGELIQYDPEVSTHFYFRYIQSLKGANRYKDADRWTLRLRTQRADDRWVQILETTPDYLDKIEKFDKNYEVFNLSLNTPLSEFGGTIYNGRLIFAASREGQKIYKGNEQPYLDLYYGIPSDSIKNDFKEIIPFKEQVNSKFHESSAAFSPDGKTMYFTRNNYNRGRLGKDSEATVNMKIYKAKWIDDEWQKVEELPFNNNDFNTAHPTLSEDGTIMYFASDRPGGYGDMDIYKVDVVNDSLYGTPVNLGKFINTPGRESFPFASKTGNLYFSSDGHPGLGGLDVFVFERIDELGDESPSLEQFHNLGRPLNSIYDDFSLYFYEDLGKGYISSNRPQGKGEDDIYGFIWVCNQFIDGLVLDSVTKEPINEATVTVDNWAAQRVADQVVGPDGAFKVDKADCGKNYTIHAEHPDYFPKDTIITIPNNNDPFKTIIYLDPIPKQERPVLTEFRDLAPIYFDFDKSNIRLSDYPELARVLDLMKKFPDLKMEIKGHCDSRGSDAYNMELSFRRFKVARDYVVKEGGIDPSRIIGGGYGERELINECADGVPCSEAKHQMNRRTEFAIVED